jgi:SAM-dependent methyltransferase
MNAALPDPVRDAWSRHWATGAPHSCVGSFGTLYGGDIARFWREVHADTEAGARVLDVATGNGAVLQLLLSLRPALDCRLTGVDAADPAPGWVQALPDGQRTRVDLRGSVDAAALPFPDGSFDLVTSQYGIEYARVDAALGELLRVRAPAGRVALVLHHAASRPVTLAARELSHMDWLAQPDGPLDAAEDIIEPMARSASAAGRATLAGDTQANLARRRFNDAMTALGDRAAAEPDGNDLLLDLRATLASVLEIAARQGEAAARGALAALRTGLADSRVRLAELRRCALDEAALRAWVQRLAAGGLEVRTGTVAEAGHLLGWTLHAAPAP